MNKKKQKNLLLYAALLLVGLLAAFLFSAFSYAVVAKQEVTAGIFHPTVILGSLKDNKEHFALFVSFAFLVVMCVGCLFSAIATTGLRRIVKAYNYFLKRINTTLEESDDKVAGMLRILDKVNSAIMVIIEVSNHADALFFFVAFIVKTLWISLSTMPIKKPVTRLIYNIYATQPS